MRKEITVTLRVNNISDKGLTELLKEVDDFAGYTEQFSPMIDVEIRYFHENN